MFKKKRQLYEFLLNKAIDTNSRNLAYLVQKKFHPKVSTGTTNAKQYIEDGNLFKFKYSQFITEIKVESENSLISAVEYGEIDIIKYLIEQGANIHFGHDCLLLYSIAFSQLKTLKFLVEQGLNFNNNRFDYLEAACKNNNYDIVVYLIENNIIKDINKSFKIACEKGYLDIIQYMAGHGVDINSGANYMYYNESINDEIKIISNLIDKRKKQHLNDNTKKRGIVCLKRKKEEEKKFMNTY